MRNGRGATLEETGVQGYAPHYRTGEEGYAIENRLHTMEDSTHIKAEAEAHLKAGNLVKAKGAAEAMMQVNMYGHESFQGMNQAKKIIAQANNKAAGKSGTEDEDYEGYEQYV